MLLEKKNESRPDAKTLLELPIVKDAIIKVFN